MRFLKINEERFKNIKQLKKKKNFEKMSFFMASKDANQCRSHHQKMLMKFKSIPGIL